MEVITRRYKGLKVRENLNGINIIRIPIISTNKILEKITFILFSLCYLLLRNKRYKLVIASQIGSCAYIASIYKKMFNIPFICRIAGREVENLYNSKTGIKKLKKITDNVDYIIAINKKIYSDLVKIGFPKNKIKYITNGIYLNEPVDIISNFFIQYCGRIEKVKGLDVLLEAMVLIQKKDPTIKLLIVGDGSEKDKLKYKYSKLTNVRWIGEVVNPQKYYKKARLLVLPSRYEGISNTLLEAMSYGIPVIATNVGGNSEVIEDTVDGLLVSSENPQELASAILKLFYNETQLKAIQQNQLKKIKEQYSIATISSKYLDIIESLR